MTKPADFRIAINKNLYGNCSSIVAYQDNIEVGRASRDFSDGKFDWLIGPSGFEGCDDFDLQLFFDPSTVSEEAMLARVETALRFSISAAMAFGKEAA